VWRLVTMKVATLTEIDTAWSLDDILDANAVLDYQAAAQELAEKRARG
jgi:hypothetical protein